jgi:AcrR family transcriptional regulator
MDTKKARIASSLYADGKTGVTEICSTLGVSKATFYRHVKALPEAA